MMSEISDVKEISEQGEAPANEKSVAPIVPLNVKETDNIKKNEFFTKVIKNPKRVAAGKKGVEARMLKAKIKRKEAELLKKENIELKQITMTEGPQSSSVKKQITASSEPHNKNFNLIYLSIGFIGLGLYMYNLRKQNPQNVIKGVNVAPGTLVASVVQKKEIDPFEF